MASILLSYVGTDGADAKRLIALLEMHNLRVHVADADAPAFDREHVVVVIWSAASLASPDVYEQARIALKAHRLIQVTAGDLDESLVPAVFRVAKPGLLPIRDGGRILEQVRTVLEAANPETGMALFAFKDTSMPLEVRELDREGADEKAKHAKPERQPSPFYPTRQRQEEARRAYEGPMKAVTADSTPAMPPPIPPHLTRRALEKEVGQLNHKIPNSMRVGVSETIEVRLGRAHQVISVGLVGGGDLAIEDLPIVETMTVNLYGSPAEFQIVRQSRETQLVKGSLIWNGAFSEQRFGKWLWQVTPKVSGTHKLVVHVSADMNDRRGVATTETYGDRIFVVKVRVNFGQASMRVLRWTAAGAVSGLAGAYTQEIWWPKLKTLLVGAGLLS